MAVYEAAGTGIHLPLELSNPLLAILKQALDKEEGERSVGQALANALLESVLQAVDTETERFPALIVSVLMSRPLLFATVPTQIEPSSCVLPYAVLVRLCTPYACVADCSRTACFQKLAAEYCNFTNCCCEAYHSVFVSRSALQGFICCCQQV